MATLARFVLRHRRLVVLAWLLAFLAGSLGSQKAIDRLSFDFSLPGQAGYETSVKVLKTYGTASQDPPYLLVVSARPGGTVSQPQADAAFAAVQRAVPRVRVVGKAQTGDAVFATKDGRAQFAFAFGPPPTGFTGGVDKPLRDALAANAPPGLTTQLSGLNALASGGDSGGPGLLVETLLGGLGALAVLAFVFASLLALVPLLIAAVAILTTFLILLGLTYLGEVSFIVQFLVALIGLGVAIDYSLLIVTRWREERAHGRSNHDAVVTSMETAGHAVVFSGLTVAVGLVALVVIPVPFLRSIGYGGMLIPLVSVAVAMTLLPAILGGIGPRVDWPRVRQENTASRFWSRWGRWVVRRRLLASGIAGVILLALIIPIFGIKIGTAQSDSLAKSGPAYEGLKVLENGGVPRGVLTPVEVLVSSTDSGDIVESLRGVEGVVTAVAPSGSVSNRAGTTLALAVPDKETASGTSVKVVRDIKSTLKGVPGAIGVSGVGALQLDYLKGVYGNFPYVLALIVILTYVLLVRAFRSLLLPLKAVLLNLASVAATFGALLLFWQEGYGSTAIFGIEPTGAITFWLPLMVFAFLFGLSMDYEVFILARMREEYDATGRTDEAVIEGLGRTGRLVTSAALILFLAFVALASGPQTDIKLFATGLGFGIMLDATVVRMLLVPALVSLFGRWNWYLPDGVARILRVQPSHARPEPDRRGGEPVPERVGAL